MIWIHDAAGERAISSEGYALAPRLSRNGTRAFYLLARDLALSGAAPGCNCGGWLPSSAELRSMDLASGKSDTVLPGVSMTDYDISRDEKEVAFTTMESNGESTIWLAPLDRSSPPRRIAAGDEVSFGTGDDVIFRSLEENNALVRIRKDGTGRGRITSTRGGVVHAMDVGDVRMIQRCENLCFTLEARKSIGISSDVRKQHLDRDVSSESRAAGAVDFAHSSGAKWRQDLVSAEASADG